MNSTEIKDLLTVVTAFTGLGGAVIGVCKYFKYQSRRTGWRRSARASRAAQRTPDDWYASARERIA